MHFAPMTVVQFSRFVSISEKKQSEFDCTLKLKTKSF